MTPTSVVLRRKLSTLALITFWSAVPRPALAQDAEKCVSLHTKGQELQEKRKWTAARENFVSCALDACPSVVREECARLLASLDGGMPTVVFQARDAAGQPTLAVEVRSAGKVLLKELQPTAVPIDPGQHRLTFHAPDGTILERQVIAVEGQKSQRIEIDFPARKAEGEIALPAEKQTPSAGVPAGAYVLGAVAIVGLGGFGYFSLAGKSKQSDLESSCAPGCSDADYDRMQRDFIVADVSLGVGLLAGGLATWLVLGRSNEATQVGFTPLPSGVASTLRGHF